MVEGAQSSFFAKIEAQLAQQGRPFPPVGSSERTPLELDFSMLPCASVFSKYWTYRGSLTTPACKEVVWWFVAGNTYSLGAGQFGKLNGVSIDSVRALQPIRDRAINV